jgi:molecular chaperone DnaK
MYYTSFDGQDAAEINVFQGEEPDVRQNQSVGGFLLDGLDESADEGNEILVRFDLNLDGILNVTAVERATGLEKRLTIHNAISQFRAQGQDEAKAKLAAIFGDSGQAAAGAREPVADRAWAADEAPVPDVLRNLIKEAIGVIAKATNLLPEAGDEDASEMQELIEQLEDAIAQRSQSDITRLCQKLEDIVFYLQDA